MRILPKYNNFINQQWITDKTRFSYDGLKSQRLQNPMQKIYTSTGFKKYINLSWKDAFLVIQKQFNILEKQSRKKNIKGIIGPFIDKQSIWSFKNFINKLGSNDISIQHEWNPSKSFSIKNEFSNINIDFRSNYLLNTPLNQLSPNFDSKWNNQTFENIDFVLLLGINPRYEASIFNLRLRTQVIRKNLYVAYIGFPMNLTYKTTHLGTDIKTLYNLSLGKNYNIIQKFLLSKNPFLVMGTNLVYRKDSQGILYLLKMLLRLRSKIYDQLCDLIHVKEKRLSYTLIGRNYKNIRQ